MLHTEGAERCLKHFACTLHLLHSVHSIALTTLMTRTTLTTLMIRMTRVLPVGAELHDLIC